MDVARQAGLTAVVYAGGTEKDHLLESTGSGAAFLDYDRDGRLDVYLVNGWALDENPSRVRIKGRNVLYRNIGHGKFEDVTERAGVGDDGWGCGVCVGDYDNDGYVDVYVTNYGPNRLYRNRGDGSFEEVSRRAGVDDPGWGGGATFFDADADGDLDLYVVNYVEGTVADVLAAKPETKWREKAKVMTGPFGMRGGRDRFFLNQGDGTFVDRTDVAGMTDEAESYGLGVLGSDLDNDGDVDVYVANDSNPNFLYRNDGNGQFTEMGGWSGAGFNSDGAAQAGMGVDAGDFDHDGLQEIFVTNFARDTCTLYHNTGEMFFEDVTDLHEIKATTFSPLSWGCAFVDVDLDADLDVFIVNGHIYPQVDRHPEFEESYAQTPILLDNDGGRLVNLSGNAGPGFLRPYPGRGLAVGDYDDDGDPDFLLSGMDVPPVLLRNETSGTGHWLKLRILNRFGSPAINARASVTTGDLTQMREVRSGSTYQSQNAMDILFGLGEAERAGTITVRWPNGQTKTWLNQSVDQTITLKQPTESDTPPSP